MIVVLGTPALGRGPDGALAAAGLAARVAVAVASAGSEVELVGRVGEDAAGEALLIALGRAGVGHRAMLRDARPTAVAGPDRDAERDGELAADALAMVSEPVDGGPAGPASTEGEGDPSLAAVLDAADVEMGLRYMPTFGVLVAVGRVDAAAAAAIQRAVSYVDATAILVAPSPAGASPDLEATVFGAPRADPDGAFAAVVARYAVAVEGGAEPAAAFRSAVAAGGWDRAEES